MFQVHDPAHFPMMVDLYKTMNETAQKDGKRYFVTDPRCGPALQEERAKGYNFVAQTVFKSREDMRYYDEDCTAHQALKAKLQGKTAGPPMVVCYWSDGQLREEKL